jgi:GNAT superfamily N-acetyltransferase
MPRHGIKVHRIGNSTYLNAGTRRLRCLIRASKADADGVLGLHDPRARGRRLGGALLRDAWQRCENVSREADVRAMLVHALDERACGFYERYGFIRSPIHPLTLMLPLGGPR